MRAPPDEAADDDRRRTTANELLGTLTAREKRVLELRFGFGDHPERTLEEVGHELSLTRERIRQIEKGALAKLRERCARDGVVFQA